MVNPSPVDARFFLSSHCPHCATMLVILCDLVKAGKIDRLEVVNVEIYPEQAIELGVRSVPWIRIGPFELSGARSRGELEFWIERAGGEADFADYFHALLKEGALETVLDTIQRVPDSLKALLPIVSNTEASLNVRIGAGVVFEEMAGTPALAALLEPLGALSRHGDARVRADACHYLGLTASPEAAGWLRGCLSDVDPDVREIAGESLERLDGMGC